VNCRLAPEFRGAHISRFAAALSEPRATRVDADPFQRLAEYTQSPLKFQFAWRAAAELPQLGVAAITSFTTKSKT
jgi:hypothetical protein